VKVTPHKNDVGDYEKEKGQDKSTCCLVPGRLAGQESRVYRNHAADESLSLSGVSRTALLGRLQINSEKALPVLIE